MSISRPVTIRKSVVSKQEKAWRFVFSSTQNSVSLHISQNSNCFTDAEFFFCIIVIIVLLITDNNTHQWPVVSLSLGAPESECVLCPVLQAKE